MGREGEEEANWAWSGKKEREMGERWGWTVLLGRETEENEGGFSSHAQHVRDLSGKRDGWLMHGQGEMKPRPKKEKKKRKRKRKGRMGVRLGLHVRMLGWFFSRSAFFFFFDYLLLVQSLGILFIFFSIFQSLQNK